MSSARSAGVADELVHNVPDIHPDQRKAELGRDRDRDQRLAAARDADEQDALERLDPELPRLVAEAGQVEQAGAWCRPAVRGRAPYAAGQRPKVTV
jgi:hypothetical protein